MPAIQPARLRIQTARLAELFGQPTAFVRALHGLLGLYSDRTHRPGQSGKPPPLVASYNVPRPVLRQLLKELYPIAAQDREQTLTLCQALWAEPYFEYRILAAALIGDAPASPPEPILALLASWLATAPEESILAVILDEGFSRIREECPANILNIAAEWLQDQSILSKQNAVRMLRPLAAAPDADHLPEIFHIMTPLLRRIPSALRPDVISLLTAAAEASPQETAFVLRQNLEAPESPDTAWLVRQLMDKFPPKQQETLKAAMVLNKKDRTVL